MTEDLNDDDVSSQFNAILNASYLVYERKLLRDQANIITQMAVFGRQWAYQNAPDYIFDLDTPVVEFVDLIGFGIDAYWELRLLQSNPHYAARELTEGPNERELQDPPPKES